MFRDLELRAAQLAVVGGALAILAGTYLTVPSPRTVVLGGVAAATMGAVTFSMRLSEYRWEYPRVLAAAGGGILLVFLFVLLVLPGPGQEPLYIFVLFSPAAFGTGIILLATGTAVLWRRWKQTRG